MCVEMLALMLAEFLCLPKKFQKNIATRLAIFRFLTAFDCFSKRAAEINENFLEH